jgi:hypothetical protein
MAKEDKSQKVVETYKAVATGIASVVTAIFTSKLGVAGTLIGTGLAAMTITLISAILRAQLEKASNTISGLPGAVQGRFSTQQIRIPGKQSAEPNPKPVAARGRISSLLSRLRAIPGFLRYLPSVQKRKVLLAGVSAGLVAMMIGLFAITGVEAVAGETLSCLVWKDCQQETSSGETKGARTSIGNIFGGSSGNGGVPSQEQQVSPGNDQQAPQQPAGAPVQPGARGGAGQPGVAPEQDQPGVAPEQGGEAPAQSGAGPDVSGKEEPAPQAPQSSEAPEQGQAPEPRDGQEKRGPGLSRSSLAS